MRYGEALPPGFKVPFGLGSDMKKNPFQAMSIRPGDICMDCGACVGMWSIAALEEGAGGITAFEPAPKNVRLLRENLRGYKLPVVIVEAALVGHSTTPGSTVTLNMGMSVAHTIGKPRPGMKGAMRVPSMSFRTALEYCRPTVVKIDVEGAEYELFRELRPGDLRGVRSLFIEFHSNEEHKLLITDPGIRHIQSYVRREGLVEIEPRLKAWIAERPRVTIKR